MKELYKNLHHKTILLLRHESNGFTLIELLVVIIIVGILTGITLPGLIRQSNRARAVEGITNIAAVNRYQLLYYQRNLRFSNNLNDLDIRLVSQYYQYAVDNPAAGYAGVKTVTQWTNMKAVSGAIKTENGAMKSLVCVSEVEVNQFEPSVVPVSAPVAALACPPGYSEPDS